MVHNVLSKQTDLNYIESTRKNTKGHTFTYGNNSNTRRVSNWFLLQEYFLYLAQNNFPSSKAAIIQVETQAERCLLLDSFLFRIQTSHGEQKFVLFIPESCLDHVLNLYLKSIWRAQQRSLSYN